jgi:hypothetical protein
MQDTHTPQQPSLSTYLALFGVTMALFVLLTLLAGLPPAETAGAFAVGVLSLLGVTVGLGALAWHWLIRPLPAGLQPAQAIAIAPTTRSLIALFLTLGTVGIGIAASWDEMWHSFYGIPFGEDFWWRPHLLMYFSFGTVLVVGGWSWWVLMMRSRGTLQQRFRGNGLLGFGVLTGLFAVYALAADPIWHAIYGVDITPWSLPHLMLLVLTVLMALMATGYHKTLQAPRAWQVGFRGMTWREVMILAVMAGSVIDFALIFTVEWYIAGSSPVAAQEVLRLGGTPEAVTLAAGGQTDNLSTLLRVATYPDGLLFAFIGGIAGLFGVLSLHLTRIIGAATLTALMALGMRVLLEASFDGAGNGLLTLYPIALSMVALDVLYAVRRGGVIPTALFTTLAGGVAVTGITGALLPLVLPFMGQSPDLYFGRLLASLVSVGAGVWLAQVIGRQLEGTPAVAQTTSGTRWDALVYGGFGAFVVWFIVTAPPPV